jgi:hypothetical protein
LPKVGQVAAGYRDAFASRMRVICNSEYCFVDEPPKFRLGFNLARIFSSFESAATSVKIYWIERPQAALLPFRSCPASWFGKPDVMQ